MTADVGDALAALIGVFSLVLAGRAILQPNPAAAGFGVTPIPGLRPYMAIKGSRDLAVGLLILALVATADFRAIGVAVLAATAIPLVDGTIVLRTGGAKAIALGVHYATAVVMTAAGVLVLVG